MKASTTLLRALAWAPSRAAIAGVGLSAVVVAAGGAYAAWSVSGTGNATGTSATISALTVSATITTNLYPGASSAVSVTVTNPNAFPVSLTSLSFGTVASGSGSCANTNLAMTNPTSFSMTVPASGSTTQSLAGAASLLAAAPTACAGVTFTVPATVSGTSS